jgi:hypothetical protein
MTLEIYIRRVPIEQFTKPQPERNCKFHVVFFAIRRIKYGKIKIHAKDDESIGKDEFLDIDLPIDKILNENETAKTIVDGAFKWGGECRLEVKVFAQVTQGGVVSVFGDALLFEGASENTSDLDGRKSIGFIVPKTTQSNPNPAKNFTQVNNEDEGGDYAQINLTLRNFIVELE